MPRLATAFYFALRLACWLVTCAAIVAALWVLFFALLGQVTFEGTILHLDNFASRYIAADSQRQAAFKAHFWIASGVLFLLIAVLRRHALADFLPPKKETAHGRVQDA